VALLRRSRGELVPDGSLMNRSIPLRSGQCHVQKYMRPLLAHIEAGPLDPTLIITHRLSLDDAPRGVDTFKNNEDGWVKVVLKT
jgi:threonine dehydrogenase-like Zn-dependent dehydrogenase